MDEKLHAQKPVNDLGPVSEKPICDEDAHLMVYGNIKIRDIETNELLINQRF